MNDTLAPYGNADHFQIPYPEAITKKTGSAGMTMPIRDLFEMVARDIEKNEPKRAAFYREVALHFNHCVEGEAVYRNLNGAILVDYDDWDEITDEQRLVRGNRNAAIAILDRLRFHLEMLDDDPENNDAVNDIRRTLGALVEPLV